jgi:hypothetical protein
MSASTLVQHVLDLVGVLCLTRFSSSPGGDGNLESVLGIRVYLARFPSQLDHFKPNTSALTITNIKLHTLPTQTQQFLPIIPTLRHSGVQEYKKFAEHQSITALTCSIINTPSV